MAQLADVMGVSPEVYRSRASKRRSFFLPRRPVHSLRFFYAERSRSAAALHARFYNATLRRYSVAGVEPPASLARFPHGAHHPP
eukprot:COSAG04_NODE_7481_length_1120_cov_1.444662_2_plen_83_part_01